MGAQVDKRLHNAPRAENRDPLVERWRSTAERRGESASPGDVPPYGDSDRGSDMLRAASPRPATDVLLTAAGVLFLFALFRGPVILWHEHGFGLVPAGSRLIALGMILSVFGFGAVAFGKVIRRQRMPLFAVHVPTVAMVLPVICVSDWMTYPYNFFQAPSIRGELLIAAVFSLLLLRKGAINALRFAPIVGAVTLALSFASEAAGRVIFTDDHAAVFYRLTLLRENFPWIPLYDPMWNGGTDARDFFSTGILNLFLLLYPLFKLFPIESVYNFAVGVVLFVFVPGVTALAARRERLDGLATAIASTLALSTGLVAYRWGLKYGSMGFVTSLSLIPLAFTYFRTAIDREDEFTVRQAVCAVILVTLMFLWSPTTLVMIPAAVLGVCGIRSVLRKRYVPQMFLGVLLLSLPWVLVWLDAANVLAVISHSRPSASSQFVEETPSRGSAPEGTSLEGTEVAQMQSESVREESGADDELQGEEGPSDARGEAVQGPVQSPAQVQTATQPSTQRALGRRLRNKSHQLSVTGVTRSVRNFAMNTNPLLLFFGPLGIGLLPRRRSRLLFAITSLWLITLGLIIAPLKPQLELERMLVIWSLLVAVPAGAALASLLRTAGTATGRFAIPRQILAAVALAFLLVGVACAGSVLRNRTLETYAFTDATVHDLAAAIRDSGGSGRVVFSGFVLHELDRGHLAPLAYYSKHPLVASSPVHNTWWYTDVVPDPFRELGEAGVEEYLDVMNTTAVVAHERFWREYFSDRPAKYERVWSGGRFVLFRRLVDSPTYFISGNGAVLSQGHNSVRVKVESSEVVLKFMYFPFLESSGCQISPVKVRDVISMIKLSSCTPGEVVTIRAKTGLRRTFASWRAKIAGGVS